MTVADVAFGSARPHPTLPRWYAPILAAALAVAGLVGLTFQLAGPATYRDIASADAFEQIPFHVPGTAPLEQRRVVRYDVTTRVAIHSGTLRFVLGEDPGTPRDPTTRDPLFSSDEQGHLADVRTVFGGARATGIVAAVLAAILVAGAAGRGARTAVRAIRDAAGLAALLVVVVGAVAAVAFEPAFLAFHYLFFPQGNFLFDPATSNLLAMYPEPYWYGVTLRMAGTFIGAAVATAVLLTIGLRRAR